MKLLVLLLSCFSLLVIGIGCWLAWKPAGLIVPGALLWIDLFVAGMRREPVAAAETT